MKKETLEQAAKQWAYDWGNDSGYNSRTDDLEDGFIAGASWREQQDQKNSQLEFVVSEVAGIKLIPSIWINNPCAVVSPQAASLLVRLNSSYHEYAKLLAEKDKEIERLREYKFMYEQLCK